MKKLIAVGSILFLLVGMASAVFDYIEVNEKYGKQTEKNYESVIYQIVPDPGLLEVSCFFWEDYISMTAITDNSSVGNGVGLLYASLRTYINLYNDLGFPNKAKILIEKPGGGIGKQIVSAVVYSKWVKDYNADSKANATRAQYDIMRKFADTFTSY